jgi:hypothetical protein
MSEKYRGSSEEVERAMLMSANGRAAKRTTTVYLKTNEELARAKTNSTLAKLLSLRTRLKSEDVKGALRITRELILEEKWRVS